MSIWALLVTAAPAVADTVTMSGSWTAPATGPMTTQVPSIPTPTVLQTSFTAYNGGIYDYTLYSFTVGASGTYNAAITTTNVVNTSWFLTGTFSPSNSGSPSTPISNFFSGIFSGGGLPYTDTYSSLILTAGTTYSILLAYDSVSPTLVSTYSIMLNGPGCIAIAGHVCVIDTSQSYFTQTDPVASGSTITFDGGTLRLTATAMMSQSIVVQSAGGVIDSNGNVLYLSGPVTGSGPLTVVGTNGGEVHFNNLVAVPVLVDPTGTLRGIGTIAGQTTVRGTLSPGNSPGTLTFLAPVTMEQGSTLALDIDGTGTGTGAGNYSRAIVSGASFTAAGTLAPVLRGITYAADETPGTNSYTPQLGQAFTGVVQASGGLDGSFSGISQPDGLGAGTRFDAVYNPTSLDLYVTPASYGDLPAARISETRNQAAVGTALDQFRPAAGTRAEGDVKTLFDALAPLTASSLPRALSQIAGEGNANLPLTALDIGRSFGSAVGARLDQLRGGASDPASRDLNDLGGVQVAPGVPAGKSASAVDVEPDHAIWAKGFGSFTSNSGDGNNPGFRRNVGGAVTGADFTLSPTLRAGFDLGYAHGDVDGKQGSGDISADSYSAGAYAAWDMGPWFANANAALTWSSFDTSRSIAFGSLSRDAEGSSNGVDAGGGVNAGYTFEVDDFRIEPSVDLRYDYVDTAGYTETGADMLNLSVGGASANALRAGIGGRVSKSFALDGGPAIVLDLSLRYERDMLDANVRTNESLNGVSFAIDASNPGRNAAVAGVGVAALVSKDLKVYARYDGEFRANETGQTVTAGLRYRW